jgi:hypothetical protein
MGDYIVVCIQDRDPAIEKMKLVMVYVRTFTFGALNSRCIALEKLPSSMK